MRTFSTIIVVSTWLALLQNPAPAAPTFNRDVAPILYANCVVCHRPDQVAPMSLVTFADARPWARAMT